MRVGWPHRSDRPVFDHGRIRVSDCDAGCGSDGGPGLRPRYDERYGGAVVLDPDGSNVEAVFHNR